jgi:hypothetical protein
MSARLIFLAENFGPVKVGAANLRTPDRCRRRYVSWPHMNYQTKILRYRQPGLLRTPQNFSQSSKFLGKNIFFWY